MALTSPDNIYSPNIDDNWAVPQAMGALADSVQAALHKRANFYVGTPQERQNFTPNRPGVHWQDTDSGSREFRWSGSRWVPVGEQKILWSGARYMHADQNVPLPERVSEQSNGIILVWSRYSGGAAGNSDYNYTYVPKAHIELAPGAGVTSVIARATTAPTRKYTYIHDTSVTGYAANAEGDSKDFVLRWVLGY